MKNKQYIVFCQHNTGHGLTADIILMTANLKLAIDTTKIAESLGFEFHHSEPFVAVIEAEEDHIYTKKELEYNFIEAASEKYPGVYIRYYSGSEWKHRWLNGSYGRRYDAERGIYENENGMFVPGTEVSFKVENQDQWMGDTTGVLIVEGQEFKIKTERSGILTIDKKLDVYGNSIKPIAVLV